MRAIKYQERNINWKLVVFCGIFVAFFLNIFQPFGISNRNYSYSGILLITGYGAVTSFCLLLIELINAKLNFFKEYRLTWFLLSLLFISSCNIFYNWYVYNQSLIFSTILSFFVNTLLLGLFILPFWIVFEKKFAEIIHHFFDKKITIPSKYKSDGKLHLSTNQIILIESAGNYVIIYYDENGEIVKKMIRNTMKNIEFLTRKSRSLQRVHKSFLINLSNVEELFFDTKKNTILLKKLSKKIPVSKGKSSKILQLMNFHH